MATSSLRVGASASRGASSLPMLSLTAAEMRIGLRGAAFRLSALISFLYGCSIGGGPGRGAALSAYTVSEAAWQYMGFFAIVWMSLSAVRESVLRTESLIYSKPQPTERLALARFFGAFVPLLIILGALFLGAACAHIFESGPSGTSVYFIQYGRAIGTIFFAASASYCLALLFESPLAGALIGLYWILTMAGRAFLAKLYFPAYTQNLPFFMLLGVALLCLACWLYRRSRRGATPVGLWVRLGLPLAVLLAGLALWTNIRDGYDPMVRLQPALETMSLQNIVVGERAPGFTLPAQDGKLTSLSDFPGRIFVIALWSPRDTESVLLLDHLEEIQARYGHQGVQTVAICLSEDTGAAITFARGESLDYPVVLDWGTHNSPVTWQMSPLAIAYQADTLPRVVITDRRRRVRDIISGILAYDGQALDTALRARLADEPE